MPAVDNSGRQDNAATSFLESRISLPYPTFSKAHSREVVRDRSIPTPDPTDLTEQKEAANGSNDNRTENHHVPPSPPLTSEGQHSSRKGTPVGDREEKDTDEKRKDGKTKIRIKADSTKSSSSLRSKKDEGSKPSKTARPDTPAKSKASKEGKDTPSRTGSPRSPKSKTSEDGKLPKRTASRNASSPPRRSSVVRDVGSESANGSDATIGPRHHHSTGSRRSKTPVEKPPSRNQNHSSMSHRSSANRTPFDVQFDYGHPPTHSGYGAPPPPPPPPEMPVSIPRVDYLLQNGGLGHKVPKNLLLGAGVVDNMPYQSVQPQMAAAKVFEPFNRLLDDYHQVMNKNGSLAVATGYRSVARRLLDRLEAVFARDISSESCRCLMCEQDELDEPESGVSWGEVLELVSGRRELPSWPPFMMTSSVSDPELTGDGHIPMQKLDIDVPEEYREHFIRQSRKTKVAVDKWLAEQSEQPTSAPDEVDDETLTFAMLTHLEAEQRSVFCSLLGITSTTPAPRSDGQRSYPRPDILTSSALAIQRLYRLSSVPRDPEVAMYMLNNPGIHHVLATLAAISDDEWEILISGRFDGFLRSGAEDAIPPMGSTSRWGSRSGTPFTTGGISRGPTPSNMDGSFRSSSQPYGASSATASFGGPIALDEETEIVALAEIERDVYLGMEALEDAFEALHCKAETVRRALRERGAGLSVANQNRRGSCVEARLGTPSVAGHPWESGDDDFLDDVQSLAPDDSASNVSSSRRRRPKRRTERRTPAPVEEEDEEVAEEKSHSGRRGFWRR
ncbi:hypothetical protein PHISCL_02260 [Aspergillus sclerotialis]|uniref:5-Methylcytosine G/T mismatch-specific DNA glycosylase n=1 Tax=Aspergillus sclerotialis TaxID=2070753 RepID=A0A3A2ZQE0_9EURO|nr:hypothetical protein PHISCL_02260 [Aspergillus sclerotialis]